MKGFLLFLGNVGFQELIVFLIIIAICICIFLALRALVLWYWKVDRIVTNQEIQNRLLQDLVQSINKLGTSPESPNVP
jgi:hypothetical protein